LRSAKLFFVVIFITLVLVPLLLSCQNEYSADVTPADFYRGNKIQMITNSSAGGLTDLVTRLMVEHLSEDTGAEIQIVNKSNASGLEGINYTYNADPDGLTLFTSVSTRMIASKVMKEAGADYEIDKFNYITSVGRQHSFLFVSPDGPYNTIEDLITAKDIKFGCSSPSGTASLSSISVIKMLDIDARIISGFASESDRALAVKRGEIAGYFINYLTARPSIEGGLVKPLFVLSSQRDELAPDVPALTELIDITANDGNSDDLNLLDFCENSFATSISLGATPGVSEDKIEYLRSIAEEWIDDPQFHADMVQSLGYDIRDIQTGEEVAAAMDGMASSIGEYYELFSYLLEKYRD